ncbi:unnamed protein product [Fraxinus pennsylvanica]|uniref:TRF2/HOY1 PH-like domain-containing protein n=1 Tax=Fraxinus pennsylvanica TaxID=56036 RepID=A0AAD1ZGF5_9LAMI|nr:unnamed protein product [Fraxinus pennsylvanica]
MEDEGFSTSEEFEKTPYFEESGNRNYESDGSEQSGSKALPEFDMQEQGIMDSSENSSPLGLTLRKTPSFVDLVHKTLEKGKQKVRSQTKTNYGEKAKASNFPAKLLRIGTWQRMTTYEGDLVAKIYYAKRKIVWEILQRPLKCKIETQWSDIIGIRAMMPPNGEGTLEIEINTRGMMAMDRSARALDTRARLDLSSYPQTSLDSFFGLYGYESSSTHGSRGPCAKWMS